MALADIKLGDIGGLFTSLREAITGEKIQDPHLKLELLSELQNAEARMMEAQAKVIVAEATGGSYIKQNWRPITMLTFVLIIANNYIFAPYLNVFGLVVPTLDIPPGMWELLQIGIGGYIIGRSAEKAVDIYASKK